MHRLRYCLSACLILIITHSASAAVTDGGGRQSRVMPATSFRLWPVSSNTLSSGPNGRGAIRQAAEVVAKRNQVKHPFAAA